MTRPTKYDKMIYRRIQCWVSIDTISKLQTMSHKLSVSQGREVAFQDVIRQALNAYIDAIGGNNDQA